MPIPSLSSSIPHNQFASPEPSPNIVPISGHSIIPSSPCLADHRLRAHSASPRHESFNGAKSQRSVVVSKSRVGKTDDFDLMDVCLAFFLQMFHDKTWTRSWFLKLAAQLLVIFNENETSKKQISIRYHKYQVSARKLWQKSRTKSQIHIICRFFDFFCWNWVRIGPLQCPVCIPRQSNACRNPRKLNPRSATKSIQNLCRKRSSHLESKNRTIFYKREIMKMWSKTSGGISPPLFCFNQAFLGGSDSHPIIFGGKVTNLQTFKKPTATERVYIYMYI